MPKRVIYHPPPREKFDDFARRVCKRLSEDAGSSVYTNHEVVWGLARFLELSASILAKHMSTACEEEDKVAKNSE